MLVLLHRIDVRELTTRGPHSVHKLVQSDPPLMQPKAGQVDLWLGPLDCPADMDQLMSGCLSADEAARAERFHFARDRNRFVESRSILRHILSYYWPRPPDEMSFTYGPSGKPQISATPEEVTPPAFNLSHCAGMAIYAISNGRTVGVDIERIVPEIHWAELATNFFARNEIAKLHGLPVGFRTRGFFNCWTRKEAYV